MHQVILNLHPLPALQVAGHNTLQTALLRGTPTRAENHGMNEDVKKGTENSILKQAGLK